MRARRRVVLLDRRAEGTCSTRRACASKFGVPPARSPTTSPSSATPPTASPASRLGRKSAAAVLARSAASRRSPTAGAWDVTVRGAERLGRPARRARQAGSTAPRHAAQEPLSSRPTPSSSCAGAAPRSELPAVCDDLDAPRRPRPRGGAGGRARLGRGHRGVAQDSRAPQAPLRKALGAAGPMGSRPPRRPDARRRREARRSLPWTPRELGLRETARPGRGR